MLGWQVWINRPIDLNRPLRPLIEIDRCDRIVFADRLLVGRQGHSDWIYRTIFDLFARVRQGCLARISDHVVWIDSRSFIDFHQTLEAWALDAQALKFWALEAQAFDVQAWETLCWAPCGLAEIRPNLYGFDGNR